MGKRLVIKGADFSSVAVSTEAISESIYGIDFNGNFSGSSNGSAKCLYGYAITQDLLALTAGKRIVGIKLNVQTAGVFEVGVIRNVGVIPTGSSVNYDITGKTVDVQLINCSTTGIQTIMFDIPFILGANDVLAVGCWTGNYNSSTVPSLAKMSLLDAASAGLAHGMSFIQGLSSDTPYVITSNYSSGETLCYELLYDTNY